MSTTTFETTIKNYLDNRAREDSLFAETSLHHQPRPQVGRYGGGGR